ncbi:MAG TPA: NAD(P)-dependent oxidoreductase, partial [Sorangium sp.]|nr:NAD(P)-dependent oxidoreductase [Sorangium sp.]
VGRVHIALTADAAVDAVLDQVLAVSPLTAVVIDHSTTSPAGTAARAKRCRDAGVLFLHAPVFMSPTACRQATGVMVVSGPEQAYQRVAAALGAMTGKVWYVGERDDLAAAYKLMGNALILAIIGGLSDVYALGRKLNVSPPDSHQLFQHFHAAPAIDGRGKRMAEQNFDTLWSLAMARKDVGLMLDAVGDNLLLALLPALAARMDAAILAGDGERDVGVLAKANGWA